MADEVIISEHGAPEVKRNGQVPPILGRTVTTQVLDIATKSAAFNAATKMIRITSKGTGFWWKIGDTTVSATADTDGNHWLAADQSVDITVDAGQFIDTAADA